LPSSTSGAKRRKKRTPAQSGADAPARPKRDGELPSDRADFAHISERQFARLLDFYQIEWDYEPRSFDVEWDEAGNVVKRFTPDFYLPAFDMFIEITTMNQKLVTRKNRKVRRLRELYPDVKVKIFYQRDYVQLLAKYGLDGRKSLGS
jgi:hypoxanthine phosphoribosyltransferase